MRILLIEDDDAMRLGLGDLLHATGYTRTIDNHIVALRHHLEPDPANPRYLLTVHRVGYRLVVALRDFTTP